MHGQKREPLERTKNIVISRESTVAKVPEFARLPVWSAVVAVIAVLTATSGYYGFHRDELYFRMLQPAWGYWDLQPLTPTLVWVFKTVIADEPWAIRIPGTLAAAAAVLMVALVTREFGGGRLAQGLCAWGYGFAFAPLVFGHVLLTPTVDLMLWPAVVLCVLRAQLRQQPQWWVAAGAVVGAATYNKLLIVGLVLALLIGVLVTGPRKVLWSRQFALGVAVAAVLSAPNLIYQMGHGWPQLVMSGALSARNAETVRGLLWPYLLFLIGPTLVPIWLAGWVVLVRRVRWRPVRFLAVAFPVAVGLTWWAGAQVHYYFGLLAVIFAAGCVPAAEFMTTGGRRALVVLMMAVNGIAASVVALPLVAAQALGSTPIPEVNSLARDQIGWPRYVEQIAAVYWTLDPAEQQQTVILASNYGEAGALDRFGAAYRLPTAYSGHNELYFQRLPPASAVTAVVVGYQWDVALTVFADCVAQDFLDNGIDGENEEQGKVIAICRDPLAPWSEIWPRFQHSP